jgi:translation initiation factor 1
MAKGKKNKVKVSPQEEGFELGGGLAAALSLAGFEAPEPPPEPLSELAEPQEVSPSAPTALLAPLGKRAPLKLALSKKGRGGKTVSTLECLPASALEAREALAQALGKALGCRVWCEGELLCFQGDQRERVTRWVEARR